MMKRKIHSVLVILWVCFLLFSACRPTPPIPEQSTSTPSIENTTAAPRTSETTATPTRLHSLEPTLKPAPSATRTPAATITYTVPEYEFPIWGIHIHSPKDPRQISLAREAGASWNRFNDFLWDEIEPQRLDPPVYRWETVDEVGLRQSTEAGINSIGNILFAPEWAQAVPGIACGPFAESALEAFGRFLQALVSRYSQPPYEVHVWEIGNEPDVAVGSVDPKIGYGCWGDPEDELFGGGWYAEMLKVAYPAIKEVDPQAMLLVGGMVINCDPVNPPETSPGSGILQDCTPSRFIEGILENGGGDYFDGVSFHAYDYFMGGGTYANGNWHSASGTTGPVVTAKTAYLRNLLSAYGYHDKLLFNTEVALLCGRDGTEAGCRANDFLNTKANYAAQANAAAQAVGIAGNIWYSLTGWRASGLVDRFLTPAAAYTAFQVSTSLIGQKKFVRLLDQNDWMMGYEFADDSNRLWVVWARQPGEFSLTLESLPVEVFDRDGEMVTPGLTLSVGLDPVYILWQP